MDTITFDQFHDTGGVDEWRADGDGVSATFDTGDFATGTRLFDAISALAERANHHPDVTVTYPSVQVHLVSHDAGGLTQKDASLAAEISRAAVEIGVRAAEG